MRTPAGKECRFFYGNYFRGNNTEECRLLNSASLKLNWTPGLCFSCPVPDILLANACQNMELIPRLVRPFPFIKQQVEVDSYCRKEGRSGFDPHVGCGSCHPLSEIFQQFETD